jgi:DNA helicase-2/ATP-dependent DNA helicase PcrA
MLRAENTDEANARLENLEELVNAATEYDKSEGGLRDFIDHAALVSDTDQLDRNARVTMMTIHAAKGLEFPVVFIVGLEDGIFPHARSIGEQKELEEERRLAYVAITRAEKILYVTHSMRRRLYGEELAAEPSQFLNELPLEMIQDLSPGASWLSYARGAGAKATRVANEFALTSYKHEKSRRGFSGRTYDSADAIADFFNSRRESRRADESSGTEKDSLSASDQFQEGDVSPFPSRGASAWENLKAASSKNKPKEKPEPATAIENLLTPGTHVRHAKYGKGLVLKREGYGDNVKLTVSFPGFGQKKLIEKFANLERA